MEWFFFIHHDYTKRTKVSFSDCFFAPEGIFISTISIVLGSRTFQKILWEGVQNLEWYGHPVLKQKVLNGC